ncbi:hypothetical protein [Deinococcus sp. UYEF24]
MQSNITQSNIILGTTTPEVLARELPAALILSVVLNVNPASSINQGGALSVRTKHLLAGLEAPAVLVQAIMDNLADAERTTRTRVYYLWDDHGHLQSRVLDTQLELPERAGFGPPDLETLHFALDSSVHTAIVLVDREWGRIFMAHPGYTLELQRFENVMEDDYTFLEHDVGGPVRARLEDTDPHRDMSRRLLQRDTDNDRLPAKQAQQDVLFDNALIAQLLQLRQEIPFERLLIAGPSEARATLRAELTPGLKRLLPSGQAGERAHAGEFAVAGDATAVVVFEAGRAALELAEQDAEQALLSEVRERGVRGPDETLQAAQEGRVSQVLVGGDGSELPVWQDATGYVFGLFPDGGRSALNGQSVRLTTLRAVLPELRERFGLQVRFLTAPQAETLETEMGGLAGFLRY